MKQTNVIITGAASGIGKAAAIRFAKEGCNIMAIDLQEKKLGELQSALPPGHHIMLSGSVADDVVMKQAEALINDKWKRVDVLVHCAGVFVKSSVLEDGFVSWKQNFNLLTEGALLMSQLATKYMSGGGRIIHISSIHGERAELAAGSYSMAKAAINQLCRTLAVDLAASNILVNAIAPGFVDTAMSVVDGKNELEGEWFRSNYIEGHHLPLKRAGSPDEIASVAWFLAGPDASYITGQVITVDGGLTITF